MLARDASSTSDPLRAHLSHLLENDKTARKISFWYYGARSKQEIFYGDYFERLTKTHRNFAFHIALSSPLPEDEWTNYLGFIHDVLLEKYLQERPYPKAAEYYLCGPPMMIKACTKMLSELGVPSGHIAYDEF
jgi:Na+-transporting NADH:ubiquinone oxidoreductase subunit NqrF